MKKLVILGLVTMMLLPLLITGCSGAGSSTIQLTLNDFASQNVSYQLVSLKLNGTLTVKLESNPSTGYSWEDAVISTPAFVAQISHNFIEPTASGIVGASGTDVWVFNAIATGAGSITFNYSQPGEGGVKGFHTIYVIVTVQ